MKFGKVLTASVAAAALTVGSFGGTAVAADKVKWKVPMGFKSTLPGLGTPMVFASKMIKEASGGDMQLKIFEPKKLVPPFAVMEAVSEGKVEAGFTWIGYDQGKIPALPLFAAAPFGMEPWEYTAWNYHGGGDKLLNDVYKNSGKNVHAILCGIMGPETAGWFRKPITSLDDYKGLKIRFAGLGGKVIEKLGASVTVLPGGEIFQNLEKGTIDASEFSMPAIDQLLGFHKVVKFNMFPGWHQTFTAMHLLVNEKKWNGLDKSQQAMINTACMAAVMYGLSEGEYLQGPVMAGFPEKGVTAQKIPVDVLKQLKKVTDEVMAEQAAANADFKKVYEHQNAFRAKYKAWKNLGYLPRDFD